MVTLYSTGCPKCMVLKKKLDEKGVEYQINTSIEEMESLGITYLPVLKDGDKLMSFSEAVLWINKL